MADRDQRRPGRDRSRAQPALAGTGRPGGRSRGGPRRDRAAARGGLAGARSIRRRAGAMGSGVVGFGDDRLVGVGDAGHGRRAVRRSCRGHDSWSRRRSGGSDRVRGSRTARPARSTAACVVSHRPGRHDGCPDGRRGVPGRPRAGQGHVEASRPVDAVGDRSCSSPLVVRLDPPGARAVWLLSVQAHTGRSALVPLDTALRSDGGRTATNRVGSPPADAASVRSIQVDDARSGRVGPGGGVGLHEPLGADAEFDRFRRAGAPAVTSLGDDRRCTCSPRPGRDRPSASTS